MKTYSKDDVMSVIRELLRDKVEIESIEQVGGNEFSLVIIIGKADRIAVVPAHIYQQFLDTLAGALSHKLRADVNVWSTDNRFEYLGEKLGTYWTRCITLIFEDINVGG